ncbi:flagellar hook-associated protein 3 FlgL [Pseudomonas chlororaphis]|uniref:flagellar hook-associated protein 3 n=1 Tax=Pseudomonas chlororaphis TaxID=587753 RepID=UPI00087CDDD7|nr:flagellar hook-associated protein 3 [Pseudomonas chlororaphis]AZD65517.1 Flagellar hook-associated protein FlgL [Pseudomonas chlororaphis subsp. aurantiaca]AZD71992.1 Flagellar hook-associated protein FlgL [Pseudomonas chlororaphis subsp. aurantiaca]QIT21644.1 flagellar hook-associated protein 3 [Pseudomonas chlororaphis subsp. aurantiaca]WDH05798.1 flagellar hook-associated protein 3 [Pseudomonas chlororaphis]WDH11447.1 flagellar hook-associated protein 3 [Pseudomonas chlororaphis]
MRISTAQFYESSAANYQKNFANVVKSSEEASSLTRVNTAADDPVGASRLLQLGQQASLLSQYSANTTSIKASLGQAESVLTSITNVLARAQELATGAGSAGYTDDDRKANAAELAQIEEQLLSLMNTQDENGKYIFAGSQGDTVPFTRNSDGTYSYNGDQTTLNLPVGDTMSMATNTTGWAAFQQAINTSRSQVSMTAPAVDDGRVTLSNGQVSSNPKYNSEFRSGEPYTISFLSSTQFKITDSAGNDVTSEASQNGSFSSSKGAEAQTVSFRGVDLRLSINLKPGDATPPNTEIAGHSFTLAAKPDSFNVSRSPGNPSTAVVTGASVSNSNAYNASFPSGGAILKFTSATDYELYASPLTADSKPVSTGTMAGSTATASGVSFTFSGTPAAGDQYVVAVNNHQTQNVLDTISQLRTVLNTPTNGDPLAIQKLNAGLQAGMANLASGANQVASAVSDIGGRGSALDIQNETNLSLSAANTQTQSAIRDSDPAEVMTRLTLQQTMLQASQLAFSKIAQLGLFNKV